MQRSVALGKGEPDVNFVRDRGFAATRRPHRRRDRTRPSGDHRHHCRTRRARATLRTFLRRRGPGQKNAKARTLYAVSRPAGRNHRSMARAGQDVMPDLGASFAEDLRSVIRRLVELARISNRSGVPPRSCRTTFTLGKRLYARLFRPTHDPARPDVRGRNRSWRVARYGQPRGRLHGRRRPGLFSKSLSPDARPTMISSTK